MNGVQAMKTMCHGLPSSRAKGGRVASSQSERATCSECRRNDSGLPVPFKKPDTIWGFTRPAQRLAMLRAYTTKSIPHAARLTRPDNKAPALELPIRGERVEAQKRPPSSSFDYHHGPIIEELGLGRSLHRREWSDAMEILFLCAGEGRLPCSYRGGIR